MAASRAAEFENKAKNLMYSYGLSTWDFGWTKRKCVYGLCQYPTMFFPGRIELNILWVNRPETSDDEVVDTIRHEIAHGLAGKGHGHGNHWKAIAVSVGAKPVACKAAGKIVDGGKYIAHCDCGPHYKHRKVKRQYKCLKCNKYLYFLPCSPSVS